MARSAAFTACQTIQHVPNGDAQTANTRLAGTFAGFNRDAGCHASRISLPLVREFDGQS
jgi:hypothetical protein